MPGPVGAGREDRSPAACAGDGFADCRNGPRARRRPLLATHTISGGSKDLSRSPLSESTQRTQLPEIAEVDDSANPQGLFDGERNLQGAETIGSGGGRLAVAFDGGREAADDDVVEVIAGVHFH
jgi:hypothetical protein